MNALQVYLDSSDFSVMCDVAPESEFGQIRGRLLTWKASGRVEFRFSYAHILEACAISRAHLVSSEARLRIIETLCSPHALAEQSRVIAAEAASAVSGRPLTETFKRDDGNWLPDCSEDDLRLPTPKEMLESALGPTAESSRKIRRATAKFISPDGKLTAAGRALFKSSAPKIVEEIERQYPLTDASRRAVENYALGKESGATAMQVVMSSLRSPTLLAAWLDRNWDSISPFTTWLRTSGKNFTDSLGRMSAKLDSAAESAVQAGLDPAAVRQIILQHAAEFRERFAAQGIVSGLRYIPDKSIDSATCQRALGTWAAASVMSEVIGNQVIDRALRRDAKVSDFGDFAHCLYLPYVDLFRADSYVADAIRRTLPALSPRVVPKLRGLPERIEAALAARTRTP